jgi:hypothetical protein
MKPEWREEAIVPDTVDDYIIQLIIGCACGLEDRASRKLVAAEPGTTAESARSTATRFPNHRRGLALMDTYEYT